MSEVKNFDDADNAAVRKNFHQQAKLLQDTAMFLSELRKLLELVSSSVDAVMLKYAEYAEEASALRKELLQKYPSLEDEINAEEAAESRHDAS